jgi:hypothetical protein
VDASAGGTDVDASAGGKGGASSSGGSSSSGGEASDGASSGGESSGGAGGSLGFGGRRATGGVPPDRPNVSDFQDARAPQDFTDPVTLPPPQPGFTGDMEALVGVWVEKHYYDDKTCDSDAPGSSCTRLEIRKERNGTYSGILLRSEDSFNAFPIRGPFAPAVDRDLGYPREISPKDYEYGRDFVPGIEYRVFDGLYRDGTLSFWVSPLDLWQDWCALQSPHVWDIEGRKEYRCVPQTADSTNTDLGKLTLCTSAEDYPLCTGREGYKAPCPCIDASGVWSYDPLCSLAYCECGPAGCVAFTRNTSYTIRLRHEGDSLFGYVFASTPQSPALQLLKVTK